MSKTTRKGRDNLIFERGGQIRRVDDSTYVVKSQTKPGVKYTLTRTARSWNCSCPDDAVYCKHAWALEYRLDTKARADRGRLIYETGGQVERIASDHYLVKSQSTDESYEVRDFGDGWMCSCPDHLYTGSTCKHIQAIQFECGERRIIQPPNQTVCRYCDRPDVIRKGRRGKHHRFWCRACRRYFTDNMGFERMRNAPEYVTVAVEIVYAGVSTRKTANALNHIGCTVTHQTILNWAKRFGELMNSYLDMTHPMVGEAWRTDEIYVKIRGERKYLFAMLDADTRYWIAKQVAAHKGTDDVRPMFRRAKEVAGKVPSKLISDGAANFAEAHHDMYAPLWKGSVHESHIHMDGDMNNNQMESFNSNTIRLREKVVRGLKKDDAALLTGLVVYHNHLREHQGLPDNMTPGEAAGMYIAGTNKMLTIIQAAAKAQARQ